MLDYQILDTIADAYTPLLGLIALACLAKSAFQAKWKLLATQTTLLFAGIVIVYGLQYIDEQLHLWSSISLDYSTHTAIALVLNVFILVLIKKYWLAISAVFVFYLLLMLYQGYHGVADIVSTMLVIGTMYLPMVLLYQGRSTVNQSQIKE